MGGGRPVAKKLKTPPIINVVIRILLNFTNPTLKLEFISDIIEL